VANATARVTGLLAEAAATATATVAGVEATTAAAVGRALGAVPGDMANLTALGCALVVTIDLHCEEVAYLVALSTGLTAAAAGLATTGGRAVTRDVAGLAAAVASLGVLGPLGAVTA